MQGSDSAGEDASSAGSPSGEAGSVHNDLSGKVIGSVVQAGKIEGGVHSLHISLSGRNKWTIAGVVLLALAVAFTGVVLSRNSSAVTPPAGSSASTSRPASNPVSIAVRREAGIDGGCGAWIVTKPLQDITPPPADEDWDTWMQQNNPIDATDWSLDISKPPGSVATTDLDVTVQGSGGTPVILTGIQFLVTRRSTDPVHGGVVARTCGGQLTARLIDVNLDDNPPKIVESDPDQAPLLPGDPSWLTKPIQFPYQVTDVNGEVFKIIASGQCDCAWFAKLSWSTNGKNGMSIIDDNGKPFQIAPTNLATMVYGFDQRRQQWYVCPKGAE
jgi:hypothetical protein